MKNKPITGLFWTGLEAGGLSIASFLVGIVLARLLSPEDFGIVSLTSIFFVITKGLIDGGFSSALIQKKDINDIDYSSVFWYNIALSSLSIVLINLIASRIALYYEEPILEQVILLLSLGMMIDSFSIVQVAQLNKKLQFKTLALASTLRTAIYGCASILLAFLGHGVWAIIFGTLVSNTFYLVTIWYKSKWRPNLIFSLESIRSMFGFGHKMLFINLMNNIFTNLYKLVIGKHFSVRDLGQYSRAENFQMLPVTASTEALMKFLFPSMALIQNDKEKLRMMFVKATNTITFITSNILAIILVSSKYLVITLVGEKWAESIPYLQLLCFVGLFYPLFATSITLFKALGLSSKLLNLELAKKLFILPILLLSIYLNSIKLMIILTIIHSLVFFLIYNYNSGKYIEYKLREQLIDLSRVFFPICVTAALTFLLSYINPFENSNLLSLIYVVSSYLIIFFLTNKVKKSNEYAEIENLVSPITKKIIKRVNFQFVFL